MIHDGSKQSERKKRKGKIERNPLPDVNIIMFVAEKMNLPLPRFPIKGSFGCLNGSEAAD